MTKSGSGGYASGKTAGSYKWSNWLNSPSKRPRDAYVLLTKKCNSKCDHCYVEAGPDRKETMPMELRKKVIEQVVENGILWVGFSGGEPTVEMEGLVDTLNYAKRTYEEAGYRRFTIKLQTNAYFLRGLDEKSTEAELEKLRQAGANALDIASADPYHNMPLDELTKIKGVAKKVFGHGRVTVYFANEQVAPIGRAKTHVPRKNWLLGSNSTHFTDHWDQYSGVIVDEAGNVFSCCWQAFPIGNVNDTPLKEIIENAKKPGSLPRRLAEKNGFAKLDPEGDLGISREKFDSLIGELGECGGCHEYFRSIKNGKGE